MDNKMIALIIVVVLIIAGGAYYFGTMSNPTNNTVNNTTNTTTNTTYNTHNSTDHKNDTPTNNTPDLKISAKKAQEIAIGSAQELGEHNDTAGTPTLYKWTQNTKHTWVWHVPLYDAKTGASDGAMDIDAMTGVVIMNE